MTVNLDPGWQSFKDNPPPCGELVRVWLYPFNDRARTARLEKERTGPTWRFNPTAAGREAKRVTVTEQDLWRKV